LTAELIASTWEVAVSIGVETSAGIVGGDETSDSAREVAEGRSSRTLEEGMLVSPSEASIEEVDRLGRSRVEVAPSKSVMLLGNSSTILEIIVSVVVGDREISLEIALTKVVASASVLMTLVGSIERLWSSSVVNVGNNVSDTVSSGIEVVMAMSVETVTEPSKTLVTPPTTSVRILSTSADVVRAGRDASVGVKEISAVVLGATRLDPVASSCVGRSVWSSGMLGDITWSILVADAPSMIDNEGVLNKLVASGPTPKLTDRLAVGLISGATSDVRDTEKELSPTWVAVTSGILKSLATIDSKVSNVVATSDVGRVGVIPALI
jgi:hypothetical protein